MWLNALNTHHNSAPHQIKINVTAKSNQPTVFGHRTLFAFIASISIFLCLYVSYPNLAVFQCDLFRLISLLRQPDCGSNLHTAEP